jgi:hypothetical protein
MEIIDNFKTLPNGFKFIIGSGVLIAIVATSSLPDVSGPFWYALGLGLSAILIYKKLNFGRYIYLAIWLGMYIKALMNINGPIYQSWWPVIAPVIVITIFWYLFMSKTSKHHFGKN